MSPWAQASLCNRYSISMAGDVNATAKLIVTAWDLTHKPAQHMASWPVASRKTGWESARFFCQQHAQAEAEAHHVKRKRGSA